MCGGALAARLMDEHTRWIAGLAGGLAADEREALAALLGKLWRRTDEGRRDASGEESHAAHRA